MGRRFPSAVLGSILLASFAAPASARRVEKISRAQARGGTQGIGTAGGQWQSGGDVEVISGEAFVRFDPSVPAGGRAAALAAAGAQVLKDYPHLGWTLVALPPGLPVAAGLGRLRALSGVAEVAPNHAFRPSRTPGDPQVLNQWHLGKINAFAGWEYGTGGTDVTIAVMDAGIEATHPELASKLVGTSQDCSGGSCVNEQPPTPSCNHGTRVSGLAAAAANNGAGGAGVSWGAQLISLKIFANGDCNADCSDAVPNTCSSGESQIINALDHARTALHNQAPYGKVIVNMSIGDTVPCSGALQTAVTNAVNAGMILVAAAGNTATLGSPDVNSPGNCDGVMPVGATDENDNIASFSSRGTAMAQRGVVAPGVNVLTTDLNGGMTSSAKGTSFSAPIVAGLAALIWSAQPAWTQLQVRDAIRSSAQGVGVSSLGLAAAGPQGNTSGAGRINAYRAMRLAVKGTLSDFEGDKQAIAFPNPFRVATHGTATITIPESLEGKNPNVRIYTMDGQLVRDLGGNTTWNGRNDSGRQVATGTYIFRVKTDAGMQTGRIAVIR